MLAEGSLAPDFDVLAHDGTRVTRGTLAEKYVLIWFYPEADTPGCTIEGNGFCARNQAFAQRGVGVFGASFDAPEKNRAFSEKFGFPFRLLSFDMVEDSFGVSDPEDPSWPRRVSYLLGPDRRIVKVYSSVSPKTHPDQVLADLDALGI